MSNPEPAKLSTAFSKNHAAIFAALYELIVDENPRTNVYSALVECLDTLKAQYTTQELEDALEAIRSLNMTGDEVIERRCCDGLDHLYGWDLPMKVFKRGESPDG